MKDHQTDGVMRQLQEAPSGERLGALVDLVRDQVRRVLRRDSSRLVDKRDRLMDLGLDSLMAVELRNLLSTELGLNSPLPATLVFDYPTPEAIGGYLADQILDISVEKEPKGRQGKEVALRSEGITPERIAHLSDEQIELMLLEKLKKKQEME